MWLVNIVSSDFRTELLPLFRQSRMRNLRNERATLRTTGTTRRFARAESSSACARFSLKAPMRNEVQHRCRHVIQETSQSVLEVVILIKVPCERTPEKPADQKGRLSEESACELPPVGSWLQQ